MYFAPVELRVAVVSVTYAAPSTETVSDSFADEVAFFSNT